MLDRDQTKHQETDSPGFLCVVYRKQVICLTVSSIPHPKMLKFGSKNDVNVTCKCTVRLLEDTEVIECEFQPQHKGKYLLEQVCQQLNLVEKDYFGLRYVDATRQRHWLDPTKSIAKQVKYLDPILFSFRVKFYPPDPFRLKEEITRYQVYLQLRRDLLHGRLYCTTSEAALLAAYIVQADLGDYNPQEHEGNYVQDCRLLLKQTPQIEEKIMELHQSHLVGQSPAEVETSFLRRACTLDTYGVDPHPVKDHRGNQLYLGINHLGILTFQGSRKTHHFRWPEVHKINYEGKMFIVHLTYNEDPRTKKKHTVGFKCPTGAACRHVWRCAIEQMLFFTLPSGSEVPSVVTGGGFFSWGGKFKYSGRTEREILEEVGPLRQEEPVINRVGSLRRKAASVPATPSTPVDMADIRYSSLPRSNHSVPDSRLDGGPSLLAGNGDGPFCVDGNLPLLETVSEDQEVHSRVQRSQGQALSTRNFESSLIQEHERKPFSLSVFAESQVGDGLEDIVEEDEEEVQEELELMEETWQEGEVIKSRGVEVKADQPVLLFCTSSSTAVIHGTDPALKETPQIPNGKLIQLCDDISLTLNTENGGRDVDSLDAGGPGFNEYYFRDSFEHSSSESQLVEAAQGRSHRSSRSQTPVARGRTGSKLSLNSGAIVPTQAHMSDQATAGTPARRVQLRASYLLPALALAMVLLAIFAAVVLESSEDGPFSALHRLPEVVSVRTLYYEPVKGFLRERMKALWTP